MNKPINTSPNPSSAKAERFIDSVTDSSNVNLHHALNHIDKMLLQLDAAGHCIFANNSCAEHLGFEHGTAMIGLPLHDIFKHHLISEQDSETEHWKLCRALRTGEKFRVNEYMLLHGSHKQLPVELTAYAISNTDHEMQYFITICDISCYKTLEEQYLHAQKMDGIGSMVCGIAHDFGNMLSAINCNLFLLKQECEQHPASTGKLNDIESMTRVAGDMIEHLLSFSRQDEHAPNLKQTPVTQLLRQSIKLYRVSIPENITLHENIPPTDLLVSFANHQLEHVLLNLINNARDALINSKNPFIRITLEAYQPDSAFMQRHPGLSQQAAFACIRVEDNGCGISKAHINHLFDAYFTTKQAGKGNGLGLAMANQAITSHGGCIEVDSEPGQGTTMSIFLPATPDHAVTDSSHSRNQVVEGEQQTILFVDDNSELVSVSRSVLETIGYKVLTATDGQQAIELFRSRPDIDLFILDVVLPVMGGIECAKIIRQQRPDAAIIFSTGYDLSDTLQAHLQQYPDSCVLNKPCSVGMLSRTIHDLLGQPGTLSEKRP